MAEIACPSCGAANPAASRFCGACGTSLERACPSCGATNPAGNRFCGSCGTALEDRGGAVAALEERKVVTVLFADLTASTEMASRLDPEDLRAVLSPYFTAMAEEVDRFGGTVEKFIGDAVVAVFGAPAVHEDDPERAIRCALAMHRRLGDLNAELSDRAGGDLAMRIGINTGDVIAHANEEGIVTGEAVNIAARFQALADPGAVVVGERTHRDTRDGFAFADLGDVTVKGIERPLRVWRVDGEPGTAAARPAAGAEPPFVGREQEIALLRLVFDRTLRDGAPNLVTIVGPPGIGKSRLSREAVRVLGREGTRVLRGRCLPYGEGLTYWPLAEILKADAGILDSDAPPTILEKAAARLDPRFPGEEGMGVTGVLLSSIGVEVASDPLAGTDPEAARRVIARAWQRYLESMTSEGPVIALIEDIHWAEPRLLELLESVVARASGPAFVLCMARPELYQRRPSWGGGLSNATTISLAPLSSDDGIALIGNLLGGEGPPDVVEAILGRSEGNPFFASELLRMMIEDGTIAERDGRWTCVREVPSVLPDTVQGVIASRLDMLPVAEKRVVQDASVVGRVFWRGAVRRLGHGDVDASLEQLVDKGLVREQESSTFEGESELIFNHVLTRDVAYASIPRARRLEAHALVGGWVEEVTSGRAEEFAEILAFHFELAGDEPSTARYSLLAGNRHLRVFDADQAIEWYERALRAAPPGGQGLRSRIDLARGGALELVGRFSEALEAYERAGAAAAAASDAELEARALAAQAHDLWLLDRYDDGQRLLPAALERARAAGLADVEARLLYTAGTIRFGRGEFDDALPLHRQALDIAQTSGDVEGQALAHHGLCETYFFTWPIEESLEHGLTADRLLRELGQRSMVAHNAYMVGWAFGFLGRVDEAMAAVESSLEISGEVGNPRDQAFALDNRAELLLSAGRLEDAWRDAWQSREAFGRMGLPRGEIVACNIVSDIAAEAGDAERFAESSRAALALCDALGGEFQREIVLAGVAWTALRAGDRGEAERRFAEARSVGGGLAVAWSGVVELLAWEWARDAAGLRSIADRLEELILPRSTFWGQWGRLARAQADLLDGEAASALVAATEALELARATHERRVHWRAARTAALALAELERAEEAAALRAEAAEVVASIAGASGDLRETFRARPEVAELLDSRRLATRPQPRVQRGPADREEPVPPSSSRSLAAVVLAAGKGKRLKSSTPKVLHPVCGKPLLWWTLQSVRGARPSRIVVVVHHGADDVREAVRSWGLTPEPVFVEQGDALGTGHAVLVAQKAVGRVEEVLVANGDYDPVTADDVRDLLRLHRRTKAAATVITTELERPGSYSRIVREGTRLVSIVEGADAGRQMRAIREVGTNWIAFRRRDLFRALPSVGRDNRQREYYLNDVFHVLMDAGERVSALHVDTGGVLGANSRDGLARLSRVLRERINAAHLAHGVTIVDPETTFVDAGVRIGRDTVIHPLTFIEGETRIGAGCELGPSTRIVDSRLDDGASVQFSVVSGARIRTDAAVGPYAHVRPGTDLAEGARAGAFVEIKASRIGRGSKVPHLAYVGDATVGERTNVGAATVTVNYDGYEKHRTVIGDEVRIGSDTMLVAPVRVGDGAVTGAGSVITRDVPPGALALERSEQRIVEGYRQRKDAEAAERATSKGKGAR